MSFLFSEFKLSTCFSIMAFPATIRLWVLAVALTYVSIVCCNFEKAEEDLPQTGTGVVEHDPAQIVAKALLCFNERDIYSSCEEAYRLTESGNLNVPHDYTDQYCNGPCLTETHLVLDCVDNILINFEFYNKATIQDVRDTIKGACGHGSERGNFNVAEHIAAEKSDAYKAGNQILFGLGLMILAHGL